MKNGVLFGFLSRSFRGGKGHGWEVAKGFGLGLLLVLAWGIVLYQIAELFNKTPYRYLTEWLAVGIGLSQLVVIIPAIVLANWRRRRGIKIGLILAAALIALLNAACVGLIYLIFLSI